jgi:hypothetical protein
MTLIDIKQAYETDKDVKEYVDKYARAHRTTVEVAITHKIVQEYIKEKSKRNG